MGISLGIVWLIKYLGIFDYACLLLKETNKQNQNHLPFSWANAALKKTEIFQNQ